eukprot:CAMPEP_0115340230 /NCGR_PEP_ID=MMETSP0270-20121206/91038_1 /TAXON_ID=71861 /ORGANISM="Scrippsiella trochoidea, Strain CCMP3099" /LENGTH=88 /DNA_ID=CAMNT_0002761675 /DNA_START=459 /DNA_END=726 /DNA_ORIENTATION=+
MRAPQGRAIIIEFASEARVCITSRRDVRRIGLRLAFKLSMNVVDQAAAEQVDIDNRDAEDAWPGELQRVQCKVLPPSSMRQPLHESRV